MSLYRDLSDKVRVWDSQVGPFEELATIQLHDIASLPVVEGIRAMPDSHWGLGACVGSVIALKKAVIPAAVGVDIGCGMMAAKTSLSSHHLPENLKSLRSNIERSVPNGRSAGKKIKRDYGSWDCRKLPQYIENHLMKINCVEVLVKPWRNVPYQSIRLKRAFKKSNINYRPWGNVKSHRLSLAKKSWQHCRR